MGKFFSASVPSTERVTRSPFSRAKLIKPEGDLESQDFPLQDKVMSDFIPLQVLMYFVTGRTLNPLGVQIAIS